MCLRNLFCGDASCTWLLFIIAIILIFDQGDCCDNGCTTARGNNNCGCGCGC